MKFFEVENPMLESHELGSLKKIRSLDGLSEMYISEADMNSNFSSILVKELMPIDVDKYFDAVGIANASMTATIYELNVAA